MTFQVLVQPQAKADLAAIVDYIAADSPENADRWLTIMLQKLQTLEQFPLALPHARERPHHKRDLRQLVHGNYRIIFYVDDEVVNVVSVRHSSRQPHPGGSLD